MGQIRAVVAMPAGAAGQDLAEHAPLAVVERQAQLGRDRGRELLDVIGHACASRHAIDKLVGNQLTRAEGVHELGIECRDLTDRGSIPEQRRQRMQLASRQRADADHVIERERDRPVGADPDGHETARGRHVLREQSCDGDHHGRCAADHRDAEDGRWCAGDRADR